MSAGKFADAYGSMPGHIIETADGEQAYPQAKMGSTTKTWIRLPGHRRPKEWGHMWDPVVEMRQALYGHPDAGGYWERHCERGVLKAGFKPMGDCAEWRSCYFNS